ncbi:MAG: hypothetical protein U0638_01890 [Phycisphaerales bacterium]
MTSRPFVPIDSFERLRCNLKPSLADCRRIREVWEIRRRDNENRDSGFSVSLATQCTNELRAIAEEEAAFAIDLLKRMAGDAKLVLSTTPINEIGFPTAAERLGEAIAEFEAANQE